MSGATAQTAIPSRPKWTASLWRRQLDAYPDTGPRVVFLAITVLATIMLYYELYVGGSVSTLILVNLHMTFTFYVITIAFGLIVENIAIELQSLTGGTTGISGIPKPFAFGIPLLGMRYYWVLAFILFFVALVTHNLKRSKYGRARGRVPCAKSCCQCRPNGNRPSGFPPPRATNGS